MAQMCQKELELPHIFRKHEDTVMVVLLQNPGGRSQELGSLRAGFDSLK